MRCLQCGKDVPLLKRLAGNEFCSDAHRREYKEEYSQLALGRLLQSKPSEPVNSPLEVKGAAPIPPPPLAPAPVANKPPATAVLSREAPAVANSSPATKRAGINGTATIPSTVKVEPKRTGSQPERAQPQPGPVKVVKQAVSAPAIATATTIEKPAPVALQVAVVFTAEFERALSSAPDQPSRQASMPAAELAPSGPIRMERRIEIADSAMHPVERKLELRDSVRATPRIDLGLGIAAPGSLGEQSKPLSISTMSLVAPAEAALWTVAHREFTGSVISLGDFANFQLSTTGFEEHPIVDAGNSTALAVEEEPKPEKAYKPQPAAPEPAPNSAPDRVEAVIPPAMLTPLPVAAQAVAAARVKPVQVFGFAHFSGGAVQVPQPSGLPLRPTIVLAPLPRETAPVPAVKKRDAGVRILPPPTVSPSLPVVKPQPAASVESDLGLPQLKFNPSENTGASRMRKIVAAVACATTLAIVSFLLLGNHRDTGSKPRVEVSTPSDQWIANFAPDAKRGRKVSVLRSSMGLSAYRLDFESSIQIKGLGWAYRAQDSKNFYVSKIELEKAGLNPQYVIVHYAVINGVDQPRVEAPLRVAVPLGGHYKVRFYAVGDRFTTWLQDQQVDQWTDARLQSGGAGVVQEGVEQSTLHGDFQVTPLIKEK